MYGPFGLLVLYGPTYVYTYNMGRSGSRPMGAERLTARNFYHGKPVVMPNFPGNFRKGKMPQNALFPKEFPETLVQAKTGGVASRVPRPLAEAHNSVAVAPHGDRKPDGNHM